MRFFLVVVKNLLRNKLRTVLTALAVIALVFIHTMIVTVVGFLDGFTKEKSKDVKLILNERFKIFSNFNRSYVDDMLSSQAPLGKELRQIPGFDPDKHTVWHFIGFTLDETMKDKDQLFFVVATYPKKIRSMTDNLKPEEFDPEWVPQLEQPGGLVFGGTQARKLGKNVGDVFTAYSTTHFDGSALRRPIKLQFKVVGLIPEVSAWNEAAFIDLDYLDKELGKQTNEYHGKVSYAWLQVSDQESAERVSAVIENYVRDLRCETAATAYGRFMAPLQGVMWGIKWILMPAILLAMAIILANTFYLTVRERQTEIAVLKVLGFRTVHILVLVLGEAALVGLLAGLLGSVLTSALVNGLGGIRIPTLPVLKISLDVFLWGPFLGVTTGLVGGIIPAVIACRINVSGAFASTA